MVPVQVEDEPEILIVENEDSAATSLEREFKRLGFRSTIVKTQREAVATANRSSPVGIAVDIHLGLSRSREGISIIRELKAMPGASRGPFVAAVTSHSDREAEAVEAGADGFIIKRRARHDALRFVLEMQAMTVERERIRGRQLFRKLLMSDVQTLQALLAESDEGYLHNGGNGRALLIVSEILGAGFINDSEAAILSAISVQIQHVAPATPAQALRGRWDAALKLLLKEEVEPEEALTILSMDGGEMLFRWLEEEG